MLKLNQVNKGLIYTVTFYKVGAAIIILKMELSIKKIATTLILCLMIIIPVTIFAYDINFEEESDTYGHGSVVVGDDFVKNDIDVNSAVQLRGIISEYVYLPDGRRVGHWKHGKRYYDGVPHVYSSFKVYRGVRDKGRASVTNGAGDFDDGGWEYPGKYSTAHIVWTRVGINRANYDYK